MISCCSLNSRREIPSKHFFRCGCTRSGSFVSDKISSSSSLDRKKNLEQFFFQISGFFIELCWIEERNWDKNCGRFGNSLLCRPKMCRDFKIAGQVFLFTSPLCNKNSPNFFCFVSVASFVTTEHQNLRFPLWRTLGNRDVSFPGRHWVLSEFRPTGHWLPAACSACSADLSPPDSECLSLLLPWCPSSSCPQCRTCGLLQASEPWCPPMRRLVQDTAKSLDTTNNKNDFHKLKLQKHPS